MTNEQWTQELRQKMAGYRRSAPEVSWDELDRALAAGRSRKIRRLWLQRMAAAAVVLLIAGVGYWSFLNDDVVQILPTIVLENHGDRSLDSDQNYGPASVIPQLAPAILAKSVQKSNMADAPAPEPETAIPVSAEDHDTLNVTAAKDEISPHSNGESDIRPKKQAPQAPVIYPSDLRQRKNSDSRLTAKVYMSSTMVDSRQTESFNIPYVIPLPSEIGSDPNEEPNSVIITQIQKDRHIHHRQPVRFGLSLRYRLTDCWSMESGLCYTRLSSDDRATAQLPRPTAEHHLQPMAYPSIWSLRLGWRCDRKESRHEPLAVLTQWSCWCRVQTDRLFQPIRRAWHRLLFQRWQYYDYYLSGSSPEL